MSGAAIVEAGVIDPTACRSQFRRRVGLPPAAWRSPCRPGARQDVICSSPRRRRIVEFYKRAQTVVFTEKSTVQPIGLDFAAGFARTVESELPWKWTRVPDGQSGNGRSPDQAVNAVRRGA
jgi:hypothetical protein